MSSTSRTEQPNKQMQNPQFISAVRLVLDKENCYCKKYVTQTNYFINQIKSVWRFPLGKVHSDIFRAHSAPGFCDAPLRSNLCLQVNTFLNCWYQLLFFFLKIIFLFFSFCICIHQGALIEIDFIHAVVHGADIPHLFQKQLQSCTVIFAWTKLLH